MKELVHKPGVPEILNNGAGGEFEHVVVDWGVSKPHQFIHLVAVKKQTYASSARKALHSLLTDVTLVTEGNPSFPNKDTLCSKIVMKKKPGLTSGPSEIWTTRGIFDSLRSRLLLYDPSVRVRTITLRSGTLWWTQKVIVPFCVSGKTYRTVVAYF